MQKLSYFSQTSELPKKSLTGFEFSSRLPRGIDVYVLEAPDRVKIGISRFPQYRVLDHTKHLGLKFTRIALTPSIVNGFEIETAFKRTHKPHQIVGEWYSVSFEYVCRFVEEYPWQFDNTELGRSDYKKWKKTQEQKFKRLRTLPHGKSIKESDVKRVLSLDMDVECSSFDISNPGIIGHQMTIKKIFKCLLSTKRGFQDISTR